MQRLRVALVAEFLGTALLLAAIVGSGIMAQRLAHGNDAVALLANAIATGGVLFAIIAAFGPLSGAHFNPAVTLGEACLGGLPWRRVPGYLAAQLAGAAAGVMTANVMFSLPPVNLSTHARHGAHLGFSEAIATFGLLAVIWCCSRSKTALTPFAVAAYITGAYWFTSSTSFANPAVTVARSLSDTFAGISPVDILPFIGAQLTGAAAATGLFFWLERAKKPLILFVCKHNTGRSQMAEAYLRSIAGDIVDVQSAGTIAADVPDPGVVAAMAEDGIDISAARPKLMTPAMTKRAGRIITMGCDVTGVPRIDDDWGLPDPKGQSPQRLREIRDEVKAKVTALAATFARP